MKNYGWKSGLSLFLCLCMILPCVVVTAFGEETTAGAVDGAENTTITTADPSPSAIPEAEDTVWAFDFTTMAAWNTTNCTCTKSIGSMTVTTTAEKSNLNFTAGTGLVTKKNTVDGQNQGNNGRAFFGSSTSVTSAEGETTTGVSFIAGYNEGCLLLTAVIDFTMLPQNTDSLLPLISWTQKEGTNEVGPCFVYVDKNGKLYDHDKKLVSETCLINTGVAQTIQIVMDPDPEAGICEYALYVDNTFVFSDAVNIPSGLTQPRIRFFNNSLKYDVTLKNVSLKTLPNDYKLGEILTADWAAYQTTEVANDGTFDLRLISLLDTLNYSKAGYEVVAVYQEEDEGDVLVKQSDITTDKVYTSLADGTEDGWKPDAGKGKYILALAITDIASDLRSLVLRVRPYAKRADGLKIYGKSQYMTYGGVDTDGNPQFSCSATPSTETLIVDEDTHVRFGSQAGDDFNNNTTLEYKWNATSNNVNTATTQVNTRFTFLHFDISKLGTGWTNYYLSLTYSDGMSDFTTEIYEVDSTAIDGKLEGLTGATVKTNQTTLLSCDNLVTSFNLSKSNVRIDITDHIRAALEDGKTDLFWRIEYKREDVDTYNSTSYAVGTLYSKENGDVSRAPAIIGSVFNNETNLDTYRNVGYEPWGYAELLVDDWNSNIWNIYARDYGYSIMSGTEDTDSKAYVSGDYSVDLTVTDDTKPVSGNEDFTTTSGVKTIKGRTTNTISGYTALTQNLGYDSYGGLAADKGAYSAYSNGYFGTYYDETNNRWWFITPEGNRYIALGVCTVNTGTTLGQKALAQTKFGGADGNAYIAAQLNDIGINTSTSSDISTATLDDGDYTISAHKGVSLISGYGSKLGVNASVGGSTVFSNNNTLNVFDPDYVPYAYEKAVEQIGNDNTANYILGWTSDNEIPANEDMLIRYLTLDPSVTGDSETLNSRNAYSYAVAWTWLREVTGKPNPSIADAYGSKEVNMGGTTKEVSYLELFRGFVYYRYYSIASDAVKTAAPNQLYLGCRELKNNYQCEAVMRVAGIFCDVITLNLYVGANPPATIIDNIHKWSGKPAYVTEFYAKSQGVDSNGSRTGQTQAYSIWEVSYPSALTTPPTANTYYTVDKITTTVDGSKVTEIYSADGTTLWSITYDTADSVTAGEKAVSLSAYIAKGGTTVSVFYLADGTTPYRDAAGVEKTVPEIILTNNRGAGKVVRSQEDRGVYYETFALKMLESGFCVGWSWYRYQDNDMPLFEDANGNLVYFNDWDAYKNCSLPLIHKGENTDQSNLDANKGIVNNAMEVYTELTSHITAIAKNVYGLAEHFDARRNSITQDATEN